LRVTPLSGPITSFPPSQWAYFYPVIAYEEAADDAI